MTWEWRRSILIAVLGLGLLGDAGVSPAAPGTAASRRPQGLTILQRREIIARLNLTDTQRQAFKQRKAAFRKRMVELKNDIALKKVDRDNEIEKAAPDKARVRRLTDEIGALQGQMVTEDNNYLVEFEKLLTPAQLEKWRVFLKEHASTPADLDAAAE